MRFVAMLAVCLAVAGCGGSEPVDCCDPDDPGADSQRVEYTVPLLVNGGFDDRAFPYTGDCFCSGTAIMCTPTMTNGACRCVDTDNNASTPAVIQCSPPVGPSYGWTVEPAETFQNPRGYGDVLFLYGAGKDPSFPRSPGYLVPDGTALYFRACDGRDPAWCVPGGTITVRSGSVTPSPGSPFRLSAWFRSSIVGLVGGVKEHGLGIRARFFDARGEMVGVATVDAPEPAPVGAWTELAATGTIPPSATSAAVEVIVSRTHYSNVYVDSVGLMAPQQ